MSLCDLLSNFANVSRTNPLVIQENDAGQPRLQASQDDLPALLLVVEPVEDPLAYVLDDGEEKMRKYPEVCHVQGLREAVAIHTKEATTPERILDQARVPCCLFPPSDCSLINEAPVLVDHLPAGHSIVVHLLHLCCALALELCSEFVPFALLRKATVTSGGLGCCCTQRFNVIEAKVSYERVTQPV